MVKDFCWLARIQIPISMIDSQYSDPSGKTPDSETRQESWEVPELHCLQP